MDIARTLKTSKKIAIVGISDNPERDSYRVGEYLLNHGYSIFPVNPKITQWKGIKAYATLREIKERIDIVDIFRKSEFVPEIVEEAIAIGAKTVWMQLGIVNEEAKEKAEKAGLEVVMDRCIKIEHSRLLGQ